MSEYDTVVNFNAQEDTLEVAKSNLEHGELSKRLRQTLDEIAHGEEVAEHKRVKDHLQDLRESKRNVESNIDDLRNERDELGRKIERAESKLDTLQSQEGQYEGHLQSIEELLHENETKFHASHPLVKKAAACIDVEPEEVIHDLQERNPDVSDDRFQNTESNRHANSTVTP